jgi:hypothetical protein
MRPPMSAKHTPLPWAVFEHADHSGIEIGPPYTEPYLKGNVRDVCTIRSNSGGYPRSMSPEQKANADLIVRAVNCHDDLLEALKEFMSIWGSGDSTRESKRARQRRADMWDKANAAVAKAEGRA